MKKFNIKLMASVLVSLFVIILVAQFANGIIKKAAIESAVKLNVEYAYAEDLRTDLKATLRIKELLGNSNIAHARAVRKAMKYSPRQLSIYLTEYNKTQEEFGGDETQNLIIEYSVAARPNSIYDLARASTSRINHLRKLIREGERIRWVFQYPNGHVYD